MKRIFATLIFALPLLFCGCSEEEDILPEQRQKIVSYLERTHSPALIPESQVEAGSQQRFYSMSGSTVYRYIDNFYRDGLVINKLHSYEWSLKHLNSTF